MHEYTTGLNGHDGVRCRFRHRWVIKLATGIALPKLHQTCSRCGAQRIYDVWSRTTDWKADAL